MKHIFNFSCGKLEVLVKPKDKSCIIEYIHNQCGLLWDRGVDLSNLISKLMNFENTDLLIRGKYLLWFLIEFAISVHNDIDSLTDYFSNSPKINITISQANCIVYVAPRARIPKSLESFIHKTYNNHILKFEEAV